MANTYDYLKNAFQELKTETRQNPPFLFLIIVLLTIPMPYAVNRIAVGLFALVTLITLKKSNIKIQKGMVYPVLLYGLMLLSMAWTHDADATARALSKVLPLIVFPFCFMVMKPFSQLQKNRLLKFYSYGIFLFILFYLSRALIVFVHTKDTSAFFYHNLVTEDVNAIHVSVYVTIAFFCFFVRTGKSMSDNVIMTIMGLFIFMLSSKNIIVVFILLMLFHELFYFKITQEIKWITVSFFGVLLLTVLFSGKIRDRFLIEFKTNQKEGTLNSTFANGNVYNVSIKQAWTKEKFQPNEYFPGAAFRVYQLRIFNEMLHEDDIFFKGYGLNATDFRIEQKGIEHNVYLGDGTNEGYQKKNFHNQYVQIFAETGIFGFILLLITVGINIKNALKTKDFVHICFAIMMISLFLTESFLARQRGVVFFAAMYCLFNSRISLKSAKE